MEGEFWAGLQSALVGWTYMSRYWPEYWASSKQKVISVKGFQLFSIEMK